MTTTKGPTRRALMRGAAFAGAGTILPATTLARSVPKYGETEYRYEVSRSDAEWQALLDEHEYNILREGGTEFPQSDPKWNDYADGTFTCRGCDLPLYISDWRARVDLGWMFFHHALTDAVLTGTDRGSPYGGGSDTEAMGGPDNPKRTLIEVHCRRCGSHLGHVVKIEDNLLHCINGTSLGFTASA